MNLARIATSVVAPFAGLLTEPVPLETDDARDLLLKTFRRTRSLLLVAFGLLALWTASFAIYVIIRDAPGCG